MLYACELPRAVKIKPFIRYVIEKEKQHRATVQQDELNIIQLKFMSYVADCVWVAAVGRQFIGEDKEPSYPRWHDVLNPPQPVPEITKQDYIEHLKSLRTV